MCCCVGRTLRESRHAQASEKGCERERRRKKTENVIDAWVFVCRARIEQIHACAHKHIHALGMRSHQHARVNVHAHAYAHTQPHNRTHNHIHTPTHPHHTQTHT